MVRAFANEEEVTAPDDYMTLTYDQLMDVTFKLVAATDYYQYDSDYHVWKNKSDDADYMRDLVNSSEDVHICGIVKPKAGAKITSLQTGFYYTSDMVNHIIDKAADSQVVKDQLADSATNVFTGKSFVEEADAEDSSFDMSSLFTIDGNKLQAAFQIDPDALSVDMSSLDLSGTTSNLPAAPEMDPSEFQVSGKPTINKEAAAALHGDGRERLLRLLQRAGSTGQAGSQLQRVLRNRTGAEARGRRAARALSTRARCKPSSRRKSRPTCKPP